MNEDKSKILAVLGLLIITMTTLPTAFATVEEEDVEVAEKEAVEAEVDAAEEEEIPTIMGSGELIDNDDRPPIINPDGSRSYPWFDNVYPHVPEDDSAPGDLNGDGIDDDKQQMKDKEDEEEVPPGEVKYEQKEKEKEKQKSTTSNNNNKNSKVSCAELETFFKIIDKHVEWHTDTTITDAEYKSAQQTELDLVDDLKCNNYLAGADFELWEFDN